MRATNQVAVSAAANGKIYAMGSSGVEEYDPAADAWTARAPMPTPRPAFSLVAAPNGTLYAIGGLNRGMPHGGTAMNTVEEYDPGTNTAPN